MTSYSNVLLKNSHILIYFRMGPYFRWPEYHIQSRDAVKLSLRAHRRRDCFVPTRPGDPCLCRPTIFLEKQSPRPQAARQPLCNACRGSQSSWQLWSRDVTVATASGLQYGRHRENGRFSNREIRANWNIGDIIDIRIRCWGHCRCISGAILSKLILFFQKEAMTWSLAPTAIRFISGWPAFHFRLNWH